MRKFLVALLVMALPLQACLWDRDTIREELAGNMGAVKTIVGWFNRYPPLYYEMRLQRVTEELLENPGKASLYDDAAVACDRRGNPTEAIAWMAKKEQFAEEEKVAEGEPGTRYKTLANLGTFHAHRWIQETKAGKNPDRADLEIAIELVRQAIEENPAAHFNREKYQLLLLEWLNGEKNIFSELQQKAAPRIQLNQEGRDLTDLDQGLLGLIRLGAAWESPDVFYFLQNTYACKQMEHPRLLANLRVAELVAGGGTFLSPDTKPLFTDPAEALPPFNTRLENWRIPATLEYYEKARVAVEERDTQLSSFLEGRLASGRHPDTDPDFWKGWAEPEFPELPEDPLFEEFRSLNGFASLLLVAIGLLLCALLAILVYRLTKLTKRKNRVV
ncbi:hypothetical protein [Roseibacillus persicicus]|uniref:Uncharacterized protein n=1 Tax=Roseibacillus persicicus TaxID=454148 RepID=A0A918WI40_9BACT|nr:hypothetical protein [Roseibacillus persicicus]GHC45766.1 hypothetical protein GCM10007100_08980 [Roseibacillus persicicus]